MAENAMSYDQFTIAVVCARFFEAAAVRSMLDEEYAGPFHKQKGDSNTYRLGRIGPHNVVLASMAGEKGVSTAAIALRDLVRTFPAIQWRLLVGIGGGVPSADHDIRLGDVVVSMPDRAHGGVAQYDVGKEIDGDFHIRGFLAQPPRHLRSAVESMREEHERQDNRIGEFVGEMLNKYRKMQHKYSPPDPRSDILFQDGVPHVSAHGTPCDECDYSRTVRRRPRPDGQPEIHYGLIASGNQIVVNSEARKSFVRRVKGDVLCFEMEAAGIAADGEGCLIIRGIANYADAHKTLGWEEYAAANAAACAKELLLIVRPEEVDRPPQEPMGWAPAGYLPENASGGSDEEDIKKEPYLLESGVQIRDSGLFFGGAHNQSQDDVYSHDPRHWARLG